MIEAVFEKVPSGYSGLRISGHAGYADKGQDIVCAAVTSALLLTVNGITEILQVAATADVAENNVHFMLPLGAPQPARDYLAALKLHLEYLSTDYPNTIHLTTLEV